MHVALEQCLSSKEEQQYPLRWIWMLKQPIGSQIKIEMRDLKIWTAKIRKSIHLKVHFLGNDVCLSCFNTDKESMLGSIFLLLTQAANGTFW